MKIKKHISTFVLSLTLLVGLVALVGCISPKKNEDSGYAIDIDWTNARTVNFAVNAQPGTTYSHSSYLIFRIYDATMLSTFNTLTDAQSSLNGISDTNGAKIENQLSASVQYGITLQSNVDMGKTYQNVYYISQTIISGLTRYLTYKAPVVENVSNDLKTKINDHSIKIEYKTVTIVQNNGEKYTKNIGLSTQSKTFPKGVDYANIIQRNGQIVSINSNEYSASFINQ